MGATIRSLHPELRPWVEALLEVAEAAGLRPVVTSARRTRREQAILYQRWLQGKNRYPVAPPGTSDHELGWAVDIASQDPAYLGAIWRSWGGRWSPKDAVHYAGPR